MEIKKSPIADLESKKMLFLAIGLIVALAATGFALAYGSKPEPEPYTASVKDTAEEELPQSAERDYLINFVRSSQRGCIKPYQKKSKAE